MIVNKTTYCEKDVLFACKKTKKDAGLIIRLILTFLIDGFSLFWGIYCIMLYREYNGRGLPAWFPLMIVLLLALPLITVYRILTRKKRAGKALMKQLKDLGADKEFIFGEDSVEALSLNGGIEQRIKYSYDLMKEYCVSEDSVYIIMEQGKQRYIMPLHDDGYTEGSKEELISFLESMNVRREEI
ncbi:MAG: hypothetical protein J5501_04160 [Ruminococcus sp.]|nr:hypothetical protein [Ruminococcus sp.]